MLVDFWSANCFCWEILWCRTETNCMHTFARKYLAHHQFLNGLVNSAFLILLFVIFFFIHSLIKVCDILLLLSESYWTVLSKVFPSLSIWSHMWCPMRWFSRGSGTTFCSTIYRWIVKSRFWSYQIVSRFDPSFWMKNSPSLQFKVIRYIRRNPS